MRFKLSFPTATVSLNNFWPIQCDALKGVDGNEHNATVRVDAVLRISVANCMEHCEEGYVSFV